MAEFHLRTYQREAIDAVFKAWAEGTKRPAMVLPTGAGKTVVFAHLIKEFRAKPVYVDENYQPGHRVIVLVHRDELADQAMAKIHAIAPELSVGKVKAEHDDITADVMVCSVQTLASSKRRRKLRNEAVSSRSGAVGLIITDECHHGVAPSYRAIYDEFPDALNLGVTATLARGDGVGLGSVWDEVVYSRSILWMISKGHLADIRRKDVDVGNLDLGRVKESRGDFQVGDLGRAMEDSDMAEKLPAAYREHAGGRQGVVFTPTVATAQETALSFTAAGLPASVISGETPTEVRRQIFEDFRTGRTQVLVNCMVLTEGFDAPWASCAVIARPTQNAALYTQMVGRVLRPYPGKRDALVLNVAGTGKRICTLIDLAPGSVRDVKEGELITDAVVREAEEGNRKVPAGSLAFELKFRDMDAFAASSAAWLRTPAGVLFIECGESKVFLWPTPGVRGQWDVCVATPGVPWKRTGHQGMDIGTAMAWGEAVAEDYGDFSVQRSARWRKDKPSDAQKAKAERYGIETRGMRKGDVSDALSLAVASAVFDRFVGAASR